jgi:hypothetical protein|tara:strand:+ start:289 stop:429 length:141 start_codon:yes stop_codon:yes gene_type:complete
MYKIDKKHHEIIATFLDELNALSPEMKSLTSIDVKVRDIIRKEMRQ